MSGSDSTEEAVRKSDESSDSTNSGTKHPPGPPNESVRDEQDVSKQLAELTALSEKHSQIISLLQEGFNIPVDISEVASTLLNDVQAGWKRLYPTYREDRNSAEGLLLKMFPYGTQFMGLDVNKKGLSGKGDVGPSRNQADLLNNRLQQVKHAFRVWIKELNDEPSSPIFRSLWRPVILANGKRISDPEECISSIDWDVLLQRERPNRNYWAFFAVVSPLLHQKDAAFHVQDITEPNANDPSDASGDQGSTRKNEWTHPPIHGVVCILRFPPSQKLVSFADLTTILSMATYQHNYSSYFTMSFFERHFGPWIVASGSATRFHYKPDNQTVNSGETFHAVLYRFAYHMKSFNITAMNTTESPTKKKDEKASKSSYQELSECGVQFEREALSIEDTSGRRISLLERRYSTTITFTPHCDPIGNFQLFSITDTPEPAFPEFGSPIDPYHWGEGGIRPAGMLTGIATFQTQIYRFIDWWANDWEKTLNQLSMVVSVTPKSIEDEEQLYGLMYDPELKKTKLYFKVLQILRIFSDLIETTEPQLESFSDECRLYSPRSYEQPFTKEHLVLDHNWFMLKLFQKEKSKKLLSRISAMRREIESLRDGLFNAQSVKEAQKSRELNKIMMVFTIVTILFLPPTFVATFFGLEIFHAASDVQTRKIFWTVFSIVSVTTFVASLGAILGLLTSAARWSRLVSAIAERMGSFSIRPVEQEGPEEQEGPGRKRGIWSWLLSCLGRHRAGDRTQEQDA